MSQPQQTLTEAEFEKLPWTQSNDGKSRVIWADKVPAVLLKQFPTIKDKEKVTLFGHQLRLSLAKGGTGAGMFNVWDNGKQTIQDKGGKRAVWIDEDIDIAQSREEVKVLLAENQRLYKEGKRWTIGPQGEATMKINGTPKSGLVMVLQRRLEFA